MILTIPSGGLAVKDPADSHVYCFDWDADNLASTAQIMANSFTLTLLSGTATPAATKDSEGKLTATEATDALERPVTLDDRVTRVRILGGAKGSRWTVANLISTTENPSQVKERSFTLLIEDL